MAKREKANVSEVSYKAVNLKKALKYHSFDNVRYIFPERHKTVIKRYCSTPKLPWLWSH